MTPTPGLVERLIEKAGKIEADGKPFTAELLIEAAEAFSQAEADLAGARGKVARYEPVLAVIADGTVPPEQHGHYLAHRAAVKAARSALHVTGRTPSSNTEG